MDWNFTPFAAPLFIGAALTSGIALLALWRRPPRGGASLCLLSLAVTVYVLGYAFELGSAALAGVEFWLRVEYLGAANVAALLLLLVIAYTRREQVVVPFRAALLFAVPAITCLLAWTNAGQELIWQNITIGRDGGFTSTCFKRGPWYWVHNAYTYLLVAATLWLLVRARAQATGLIRRQINELLVGTLLPLGVNVLYLAGLSAPGIDPNPYALVLAACILAWGMLSTRLSALVPVARAAVLDSMREAVIVVDARGRLADLNPAAQELLSVMPGRSIGRPVTEVFPAWSQVTSKLTLGETLRDDLALSLGGSLRHFNVSLAPLVERPGRREGRLLVLYETTDRKQAEERLRLQAVALEAAADGILITDRDGQIQWANPAVTRMTGYPAEEVVGSTTRLLKSGVHDATFYQELWHTILAGRVWRGEMTNRRKDGSHYAEQQTIAPVADESGEITHFIAVKQDVTERKRVESLRETLVHTMVHDLRSPLTVVQGVLDLLAADLPAADSEHPLQLARRSTQRVLDLVTSILDVHRLENGKMPLSRESLDLAALTREVVDSLRPLAEAKQQHLNAELPTRPALVYADRGLLARVVQNLVGNAIKFTPPGGSIRAAVRLEPAEARVAVSVADDGPGIALDLRSRLFEEFVTGELRERGSGLGLAFCRLALDAHDGSIGVESEPGQGADFTFTLPVATSSTPG